MRALRFQGSKLSLRELAALVVLGRLFFLVGRCFLGFELLNLRLESDDALF